MNKNLPNDRYRRCDEPVCGHDLTAGILVTDLLRCDGPYATHARVPQQPTTAPFDRRAA